MTDTNDTTERFGFDRRGVSEVIGAILVFGLVIALMSIVQLYGVPSANEGVEFEHSQAAEQDFSQLRVAMSQTADTGRSQRASFQVGTTYPSRLLFYNPPPVQGSLRTTDEANVTLENVASDSSAGVFFASASVHNYSTRSLVYSADYNQMENSPQHVQEATVFYRQFDDRALVGSSNFIDGSTINLVAVGGNLSSSTIDAQTLETRPLSGPAKQYQIRNDAPDDISIEVPTNLDFEAWNRTLRDEYAPGADVNGVTVAGNPRGRIVEVDYKSVASGYNRLTVNLSSGEYALRMAKVGVGPGDDPEPGYVVPVVDEDSRTATVEVRDRFNNPVSGVTLSATGLPVAGANSVISNGSVTDTSVNVTTGPDGRASVTRPSSSTATSVLFEGDFSAPSNLNRTTAAFGGPNAPILQTDATGTHDTDQFTLTVNNRGPPRDVREVQVHHVTAVDSMEVATEAASLASILGVNVITALETEYNTNMTDGPDAVQSVQVGPTVHPLSGSGAEEGLGATSFSSSAPTVTPGSNALTFHLDEQYPLEQRDVLVYKVTVFYENGHRETYSGHLFANEA